jgi:ketosteroid isomerase-like protein
VKSCNRFNPTKITIFAIIGLIIAFSGLQALGEQWTAEQKEVWNAVLADIENFKKGDVEKLMASRHDNFVGWFGNQISLYGKTGSRAYYKGWFDYDIPANFDLEPVKILIIGRAANAYYTFTLSGKISSSKGRAVDTLVKEGDKWLLISHLCSLCDKPVPCK